jgi:hypothetical protein
MADKKIQPTNPTVDTAKTEDPKTAPAERKTAGVHMSRKSGRKTNGIHCG